MATHQVSVTVDRGEIHVEPDTLTMTSNDDVHWAGTNAAGFSIVFDTHELFGQSELAYEVAGTRQRPRKKGRFKYTVVSNDDPDLQLDPVIIVEEPPTTKP